jgi:hypothetical protein
MKSLNSMKPVCVICGTDKNIEHNHAGGSKQIAWFTVPFCERHHEQFHRLLENARVDLQYTPNKPKRLVIAALALTIALWMVLQALREAVSPLLPKKKM